MNPTSRIQGLALNLEIATPSAANFIPPKWPPPKDFPVVVDANGKAISRYGDPYWNLSLWFGAARRLYFGDDPTNRKGAPIDAPNADLLRRVVAWWLYGPNAVRTPQTLANRFDLIRPLFVLCSDHNILASELSRFPRVSDQLPQRISRSAAKHILVLLHDIYDARDAIGLCILDHIGLERLAADLPKHEPAQTPYIPPRIWLYQIGRLRAFLDDFLAHREAIEECYSFCLDAYAHNAGSLSAACADPLPNFKTPFNVSHVDRLTGERTGRKFYGRFSLTAQKFGIAELLVRWVGKHDSVAIDSLSPQSLSAYFTMASHIGFAYLLNFSMMREEEGNSLRADCLSSERDDAGETVYQLRGETTKTVEDDDARWITSESAEVAISVMKSVSAMRMTAAAANPKVPTTDEDLSNPYLIVRPYEPWSTNAGDITVPLFVRPQIRKFGEFHRLWPKVIDIDALRLTKEDVEAARLVTPTLDPKRFEIGMPWQLGWHQLRRTGAVNMVASGIVSDASVQYQLKHVSRVMSRYYGRGYYHLDAGLNREARAEYIRAVYEVVAREFSLLSSDRFVSPYGKKRKDQIINLVSSKDHNRLVAAGKAGEIAYREHLLGGCTNPEPCDKGGVDSVAACGGTGKPCEFLLYDSANVPRYRRLLKSISIRLEDAPVGSPLSESLGVQKRALQEAIDATQE